MMIQTSLLLPEHQHGEIKNQIIEYKSVFWMDKISLKEQLEISFKIELHHLPKIIYFKLKVILKKEIQMDYFLFLEIM